ADRSRRERDGSQPFTTWRRVCLLQRNGRARSLCFRDQLRTRHHRPSRARQHQRASLKHITEGKTIMKLLNHSIKARILWLLASVLAILIAAPLPRLEAQQTRTETTSVTRWEHSDSDTGLMRRLEMRG